MREKLKVDNDKMRNSRDSRKYIPVKNLRRARASMFYVRFTFSHAQAFQLMHASHILQE